MKRVLLIALLLPALAFAQSVKSKPKADRFPLIQVNIDGSQRYSKQEIAGALGLKVGTQVTQQDLEAASQRLANSGLFSVVGFRFGWAANGLVGNYELTDNPEQVPIGFDNFVWFTPNELLTAIKDKVPLFTGVVPLSGAHRDQVRDALQKILAERNIEGEVSVIPRGAMNAPPTSMQYRVDRHEIKIVSCEFVGGVNVSPVALGELAKFMTNSAYEKSMVEASIPGRLKDIYDAQGFLAAQFETPELRVVHVSPEQTQVALSTKVIEGPQYKFSKVEWQGNAVFRTDELAKALGFEPGQVASIPKFREKLVALKRLYGRVGYMSVSLEPRPVLGDNSNAVFVVEVREGPQFRLAKIQFFGIDPAIAAKILGKWTLKEGAVYDDFYPRNFMLTEFQKYMPKGTRWQFRVQDVIHPETATVDLNIFVEPK